jgi:hypothetical protein
MLKMPDSDSSQSVPDSSLDIVVQSEKIEPLGSLNFQVVIDFLEKEFKDPVPNEELVSIVPVLYILNRPGCGTWLMVFLLMSIFKDSWWPMTCISPDTSHLVHEVMVRNQAHSGVVIGVTIDSVQMWWPRSTALSLAGIDLA